MKKFVAAAAYYFCAVLVTIFFAIFLSQSSYILFPDAEWILEIWELASIWLAWAFLPMFFVTILFWRQNRRKIFLIPAVISFFFFVFWFTLLILGVVVIV